MLEWIKYYFQEMFTMTWAIITDRPLITAIVVIVVVITLYQVLQKPKY